MNMFDGLPLSSPLFLIGTAIPFSFIVFELALIGVSAAGRLNRLKTIMSRHAIASNFFFVSFVSLQGGLTMVAGQRGMTLFDDLTLQRLLCYIMWSLYCAVLLVLIYVLYILLITVVTKTFYTDHFRTSFFDYLRILNEKLAGTTLLPITWALTSLLIVYPIIFIGRDNMFAPKFSRAFFAGFFFSSIIAYQVSYLLALLVILLTLVIQARTIKPLCPSIRWGRVLIGIYIPGVTAITLYCAALVSQMTD